jgi:hypothetical protein
MAIYAAFDAGGRCLYVGETHQEHPALRWAEHVRRGAEWAMSATRWEVLADLTERSACERLEPLHGDPTHTHKTIRSALSDPDREALRATLEDIDLVPDP